MPNFVVLSHDHPFPHWDLMLESSGVLHTWRLLDHPQTSPAICAEPLPDHRLEYLEYEGIVSGNRGSVLRIDSGTFETTGESADGLEMTFEGTMLNGRYSLNATSDAKWTLYRHST